jgi:hypothetical protein
LDAGSSHAPHHLPGFHGPYHVQTKYLTLTGMALT